MESHIRDFFFRAFLLGLCAFLAAGNAQATPRAAIGFNGALPDGQVGYALAQSALPLIMQPSFFMAANGQFANSATVSFCAKNGTGVTMTFNAATLLVRAVRSGPV